MPMLRRVLSYPPDLSKFNDLVGNAKLLVIYLALNWVLAAFGEEMVWRGYALAADRRASRHWHASVDLGARRR